MEPHQILTTLIVAFGVTSLVTPTVSRLARRLGVVDQPNERGVSQREGMPLLGGLAVTAGFLAGIAVALAYLDKGFPRELEGLFYGGGLVLLAGVYDDRFGMNAWSKFSIQIAAAIVVLGYGFEIGHVSEPISRTLIYLPTWVSWPLTILWIVGVTNALNLIDGLDGLATGVGAIIGIALSVIAFLTGQDLGLCLGLALVGSLLGFLPFNFHPARIFLGDTGAMLIGYSLAVMSLQGYRQISLLTFVVPLLALAMPILDTALSILRRVRLGTPIFTADRLHVHHRLLAWEGSQRAAVLQFYLLTGAFCVIALAFMRLRGWTAAVFLSVVGLLTVRLLWNLGVLSAARDEARSSEPSVGAGEKKV